MKKKCTFFLIILLGFISQSHAQTSPFVTLFEFPQQVNYSPGGRINEIGVLGTTLIYTQANTLMRSDGTLAGTSVIDSIKADARNFMLHAGLLYFFTQLGQDQVIWKTDGTTAGTSSVDTLSYAGTYISLYYPVSMGTNIYFVCNAGGTGNELWKFDGTTSSIVADINAGVGNGVNDVLTVFNNKLYFTGITTTSGGELWQSDGTAAGTILLKEIFAGVDGSYPSEFTVFNSKLYFAANGALGYEIYQSDGTAANTIVLKDINTSGSAYPRSLIVYNSALHFAAYNGTDYGLWKTTGTAAGTTKVLTLAARSSGYSASKFKLCNGSLYVVLSYGYSYSCGFGGSCYTSGSLAKRITTATMADITGLYNPNSGYFNNAVTLNNKLYFLSKSSSCWYSSCSYTDALVEINALAGNYLLAYSHNGYEASSINSVPVVANSNLFFSATNPSSGAELWKLNGSQPTVAFEWFTGPASKTIVDVSSLKKINTKFLSLGLRPGNAGFNQIWVNNGTAANGQMIFDIGTDNTISNFTQVDAKIYFTGKTNDKGEEPYVTDGTVAGTFMLKDIGDLNGSSSPANFAKAGTVAVFTAYQPATGLELWASNGTATGTILLKDIYPADYSSYVNYLGNLPNNVLIFSAESDLGREVWRTDGTVAGTYILKDINVGGASDPYFVGSHNGYLYFSAFTAAAGRELYRTDGTVAGTIFLKDFTAGTGDSYINAGAGNGTDFIISVSDPVNGKELWKTNGTAAGTVLIKDIYPGTSGGVNEIYESKVGNYIFFSGIDATNGYELWISNGTAVGTTLLKDINPGVGNTFIQFLKHANNILYFKASIESQQELWRTDGTSAGTYKLLTLDDNTASNINYFTLLLGKPFFNATNSYFGNELYWNNGNAGHFSLLGDIKSGPSSSFPSGFINDNNILYFYANSGDGNDLYGFFNAVALPVKWESFTAFPQQQKAILDWKVSQQENNDRFEIERSSDSRTFSKIGVEPAMGSASAGYRFIDQQPLPGINFYRLKQFDKDGTISYSITIPVRFSGKETIVNLFPNPVLDKASLVITTSSKEKIAYRILDNTGKLVYAAEASLQKGTNILEIELSELSAGVYSLQVSGNLTAHVSRFIKK